MGRFCRICVLLSGLSFTHALMPVMSMVDRSGDPSLYDSIAEHLMPAEEVFELTGMLTGLNTDAISKMYTSCLAPLKRVIDGTPSAMQDLTNELTTAAEILNGMLKTDDSELQLGAMWKFLGGDEANEEQLKDIFGDSGKSLQRQVANKTKNQKKMDRTNKEKGRPLKTKSQKERLIEEQAESFKDFQNHSRASAAAAFLSIKKKGMASLSDIMKKVKKKAEKLLKSCTAVHPPPLTGEIETIKRELEAINAMDRRLFVMATQSDECKDQKVNCKTFEDGTPLAFYAKDVPKDEFTPKQGKSFYERDLKSELGSVLDNNYGDRMSETAIDRVFNDIEATYLKDVPALAREKFKNESLLIFADNGLDLGTVAAVAIGFYAQYVITGHPVVETGFAAKDHKLVKKNVSAHSLDTFLGEKMDHNSYVRMQYAGSVNRASTILANRQYGHGTRIAAMRAEKLTGMPTQDKCFDDKGQQNDDFRPETYDEYMHRVHNTVFEQSKVFFYDRLDSTTEHSRPGLLGFIVGVSDREIADTLRGYKGEVDLSSPHWARIFYEVLMEPTSDTALLPCPACENLEWDQLRILDMYRVFLVSHLEIPRASVDREQGDFKELLRRQQLKASNDRYEEDRWARQLWVRCEGDSLQSSDELFPANAAEEKTNWEKFIDANPEYHHYMRLHEIRELEMAIRNEEMTVLAALVATDRRVGGRPRRCMPKGQASTRRANNLQRHRLDFKVDRDKIDSNRLPELRTEKAKQWSLEHYGKRKHDYKWTLEHYNKTQDIQKDLAMEFKIGTKRQLDINDPRRELKDRFLKDGGAEIYDKIKSQKGSQRPEDILAWMKENEEDAVAKGRKPLKDRVEAWSYDNLKFGLHPILPVKVYGASIYPDLNVIDFPEENILQAFKLARDAYIAAEPDKYKTHKCVPGVGQGTDGQAVAATGAAAELKQEDYELETAEQKTFRERFLSIEDLKSAFWAEHSWMIESGDWWTDLADANPLTEPVAAISKLKKKITELQKNVTIEFFTYFEEEDVDLGLEVDSRKVEVWFT